MVSPPYKDGFSMQGTEKLSESSVNGAPLVSATSLGAFAGGPDTVTIGNEYLFRRTETSWETIATDPQPEDFYVDPQVTPSDEGGSLAKSNGGAELFALHAPSESAYAANLYVRTPAGLLNEIGPMLAKENEPSQPTGLRYVTEGLHFAGASSDLSHVLFYIAAGVELPAGFSTNLWPGDSTVLETTPQPTYSLYEYVGGGHTGAPGDVPALVGVDDEGHLISQCGIALGGSPARAGNVRGAISSDGDTVFFTAMKGGCEGRNLSGDPQTGAGPIADEVFVRSGGATTAISTPSECGAPCGGSPAANAAFEGASEDGSIALFSSTQKLLPEAAEDQGEHERFGETVKDDAVENGGCRAATGGAGCNLYGYDRLAPAGRRLFLISAGASSGQVQGVAAVSGDASHVYFVAKATLAGANAGGHAPAEGGENLYLYTHECEAGGAACASPRVRTTFIATLSEEDAGQWSQNGEEAMNLTPDGRFLLFTSTKQLTPDDTSTAPQVFRFDAVTDSLTRVSIGNDGFNDNGNTAAYGAQIVTSILHGAYEPGVDSHASISDDGRVVIFFSANGLTPDALNGRSEPGPFGEQIFALNVYEYEEGHVYLISDGTTAFGVPLLFLGALPIGVSPSGEDIMFRTYGALLPQDGDTLVDIYDARSDGGFPMTVSGHTECAAGACQAPVASSPTTPSAGSLTQAAGDNLQPSVAAPSRRGATKKRAAATRKCAKGKRSQGACRHKDQKKHPAPHSVNGTKARSKTK